MFELFEEEVCHVRAADSEACAARHSIVRDPVASCVQGSVLTEDELISTTVMLLIAGHETTTNLIGNRLLALLRYPAQMRRLRDDPSLIPSGVGVKEVGFAEGWAFGAEEVNACYFAGRMDGLRVPSIAHLMKARVGWV